MKKVDPDRKCHVVIYDVASDRRRARLARKLLRYGYRVQKSAFQLWLDMRELSSIMSAVEEVVQPDEDSLHFYPVCKKCRDGARFIGEGSIILPDGDIVV